ncbi:hypothetical protein GCM10009555_024230 [Acrocarpospora macrocephala]|uniref:SnoaL-like domain-containing protein n=1 Tax=Acrocarpospora macrocephala TaxID=150177 RepID=A0A5M3WSM2_9ACTN|nr:nuclear transport factor 2 family protein [Acrocarpospora macrocephala]GES12355.1 hypothetical protein Amac_059520 [Acrocarpospora macrocephala]
MGTEIEQRLARLEAIEAISRLQYDYGIACDDGYHPERLSAMFTEDAVWSRTLGDGDATREFVGRSRIAAHFSESPKRFLWGMHNCLPIRIDVEPGSRRAFGVWRLLMPCVVLLDGEPTDFWVAGRYENDYVEHDGVWRFQTVRMIYEVAAPIRSGWPPRLLDPRLFAASHVQLKNYEQQGDAKCQA